RGDVRLRDNLAVARRVHRGEHPNGEPESGGEDRHHQVEEVGGLARGVGDAAGVHVVGSSPVVLLCWKYCSTATKETQLPWRILSPVRRERCRLGLGSRCSRGL